MELDKECIFCKIIRGEIPSHKLYEDDDFLVFLDINPVSPGHFLVIPKYHSPKLATTPPKYLSGALSVLNKVAEASEFGDYNIVINNGPKSGQLVPHLHVHAINAPSRLSESVAASAPEAKEPDHKAMGEYAETVRARLSKL